MAIRRESGVAWAQRLRMQPVSTGSTVLDSVFGGGLRSLDVALIVGSRHAGKTEFCYDMAARHVAGGGGVLWISPPGAKPLCARSFLYALELHLTSSELRGSPPEDVGRRVLDLSQHVCIVACATVDEFTACLTSATVPPTLSSSTSTLLAVIDGLGLGGSILHQWERVARRGVPLPLAEYVRHLRQRLNCAVCCIDTCKVPPENSADSRDMELRLLDSAMAFRQLRSVCTQYLVMRRLHNNDIGPVVCHALKQTSVGALHGGALSLGTPFHKHPLTMPTVLGRTSFDVSPTTKLSFHDE